MTVPNTPPPSAAELLLQARTSKELSLDQVSLQTRIPRELIQALEEKNWAVLPGAPYARAFCKTLAAAYELDPELVLTGLRNDMGIKSVGTAPKSSVEIKVNSSLEESESNRTPLVLAAILALALILVLAATRFAFKPGFTSLMSPTDTLRNDSEVTDTSSMDSAPAPGIVAAAVWATKASARRAATLKLADSTRPAFLLYIRPGISRIRKKNLTPTDTMEFDPDTALYIRNLSRQPLRLSGAVVRDSILNSFFRILRKHDSVLVEPISEMTWDEKAKPILARNKSLPRR